VRLVKPCGNLKRIVFGAPAIFTQAQFYENFENGYAGGE